jgi:hypothetical protein
MGVAGIVALGSAGLVSHVLVLGPLFVGPAGAYLEARRFSSPRGSLVAAVIYAVVPVPYNALSQGHWAGLVAYAAAPWVIGRLGMLGGQAPHPLLHWDAAWFRFLSLGLLVAVAASFSPSMLLLVPFVGLGLCAGSFLAGRGMGGARFLCAALLATLVAFVVLAPWSAEAFRSWASVLGQSTGATQHVSVGQVLRLQTGPFGSGLLGWALLVVAALPLAIGRSWRLAWAARLWVVAITCMAAAWAGSRGWLPVPQLEVLLAPAGAALALSTGVGGACVEHDLLGHRFGWQQFAPAVAAVAAIACVLPLFAWVGGGQWELPASGAESAFAFPAASPGGDYRVLWVGEQSSLPMAPQGSLGQLRFATSLDGLPWAPQLWAPSSPGEAPIVAEDLNWADEGVTTALGHLLAPLAVRYIVVPAGSVPDQLLVALTRQLDLVPVGTDPGYAVFANAAWAPLLSVQTKAAMAGSRVATGSWTGASALQQLDLRASRPVVVGAAQSKATVVENLPASGAAVYGASPLGSFGLSVNGRPVTAQGAFGWAAEWPLPGGNAVVTVSPRGTVSQHLVDLWTFVVWALALGALVSGAHFGLRRQLARAALEVSSRSAERTEIDWSAAWEEGGVV